MVLPLKLLGQQQVSGFAILAISPRRALDENYRGFLEAIASQMERAIANALSQEEEHQRIETLAALDRAKTKFFSNISHEFRTPLTLMLAPLADTLDDLDGSLPPPDRQRLQLVQRNGKRLLKLVNSLLDFSRLEAGRDRVTAEPVDLDTYTAELASAFRSTIEQAGLTLVVVCPQLPTAVWIDRQMWEKIVLNLLSNAFKFTLSGTITVRLEWCGDRVELTVADTGVGIPARELALLFDRFHRVENSPGRSFEGSGIGLSLVRELVELQGGTIAVTSTVGQGSRFTVTLPTGGDRLIPANSIHPTTAQPLQASAYVEEARRWLLTSELNLPIVEFGATVDRHDLPPLPQQAAAPAELAARETILLVDDNADMRDYLQRLLSGTYQVVTATDGMAALDAIAAMSPALVLADVMMPRMDGFELLGALRSTPATEDIPIILLSARAGEEARIEGLAAGADDYVIKPFSARELVTRVEATLKLAQMRRFTRDRERVLQQETDTAKANLEQIVSSLRDGFVTFDRQWRYTYINQRLLEILNLPREEVIGRYSWEVFPLRVGTEFYGLLARAMSEQIEVQFEFYYAQVDAWVEHRVYPTSDGVAVLMADISDRKRGELLLVEQKRLLELVAAGEPLANCLAAVCTSVSKLSQGVRACIPIAAGEPPTLPTVIAPAFPPSFARGWQDAPLGTGLTAVPAREAFACADLTADDCGSPVWRDFVVAQGILACHATPISSADDLLFGSLLLCFDRPRLPTEWEDRLVEFGTNIASIVFDRDRAHLALQTSEAKYRTLFESIDEGWCICQMLFDDRGVPDDYRFIEVNSVFSSLTGLTGVVGQTARELLPDLEAEWFEIYGRVVQTGEPIRFENQSLAMNRWFDVNAFAIGEPGSNWFAVLFTNITDRKLVEQERERFLSVGADLQVIVDRHGRFQWVSPTLEQSLGWTKAEMLALAWTDLVHPDDLAGSSAEAESLFSAHITVAYESRYRHKDGSYRWFLWNAQSYPAQLDPTEMVLYAAAVDITDRKQAEIALQSSEQRLRISQLAAKIGTWDWDITTGNVIWSPEYYALYGLDPTTPATYDNWLNSVVATDRQSADNAMRAALDRQQTYLDFEFRSIHPTQGIRWFGSRSQIFYNDRGQPLRAIGISIDITDRKQVEATLAERARELANLNTLLAQAATLLEARNQELDRFVHIVAHDLKAPLRAVANLSEWIEEDLEGALTADTQQHMQRLRGRVRLMESTISGLLDYARAGRTDTTIETVCIAQLLAETIETLAPPPTFKIDIAPEMPTLETKRLLLSQVFANLIGNAFKHHDRDDGSIQISSRAEGDFYEFAISDDGPGIASENRNKIFIIFQSANPQKNPESSGIGLSIVKKIVETEGGAIRLESELDKGTTFYFTWPKESD